MFWCIPELWTRKLCFKCRFILFNMTTCVGRRSFVLNLRGFCRASRMSAHSALPVTKPTTVSISRRSYSLDSLSSGSRKSHTNKSECLSPSIRGCQRNLSAVALPVAAQFYPPRCHHPLDLGDVESNTQKAMVCRNTRTFIVDPALATTLANLLGRDIDEGKAVIFEVNPGPGVFTRALLNRGAQRVVALESNRHFLPDLQELESNLDEKLDLVHCDFFRLDTNSTEELRPSAMTMKKIFSDLGISEIFAIIDRKYEQNLLWRFIYNLFDRYSFYYYGRLELIIFITQKQYMALVAPTRNYVHYLAYSVLAQMACDIELLHEEPLSSFLITNGNSVKKHLNQNLCMVRITPRKDLFSGVLTPLNSSTLVMMVKQCLVKRKSLLMKHIDSWSPGMGFRMISKLGYPYDVKTGDVSPNDYKLLFEMMKQSGNFGYSWLFMEKWQRTGKS
ncbi:hypothetical protein DNTS_029333 [Danionella cerebrum]|uniref:rRNA adenine N(6)-methyltransferase n=1 Tax=Danionella cerebrum TaxID=2873325 RepID=A0A553NJZ5_9TELE|nr:hypothetical protein DNTS_029333 [Danionella translucida]